MLSACSETLTLQDSQSANINMRLGLNYLSKGNVKEAKSKLFLALSKDQKNYEIHDAIGYLFEKSGENSLAEQYYLKGIKLASKNGAAYNNYGAFLYRQKRYSLAVKYFLIAANDTHYMNAAVAYKNAQIAKAAESKKNTGV